MKGTNEFRFNFSTMAEALELYFADIFGEEPPKVSEIREETEHGAQTFVITINSPTEPKP